MCARYYITPRGKLQSRVEVVVAYAGDKGPRLPEPAGHAYVRVHEVERTADYVVALEADLRRDDALLARLRVDAARSPRARTARRSASRR